MIRLADGACLGMQSSASSGFETEIGQILLRPPPFPKKGRLPFCERLDHRRFGRVLVLFLFSFFPLVLLRTRKNNTLHKRCHRRKCRGAQWNYARQNKDETRRTWFVPCCTTFKRWWPCSPHPHNSRPRRAARVCWDMSNLGRSKFLLSFSFRLRFARRSFFFFFFGALAGLREQERIRETSTNFASITRNVLLCDYCGRHHPRLAFAFAHYGDNFPARRSSMQRRRLSRACYDD